MIIRWRETDYECSKAIRNASSISLYNADDELMVTFFNLTSEEWKHISVIQNGEETGGLTIPTELEATQSELDYLRMENEYLENRDYVLQADLDYCLMLLGE